ncbi:MAG: (p)ppGpp synthetase [Spirochaetaceae bacterium]|jgi:ppGpp synthetase/RelA/SpoT-type nucleotidyltranferase|nr:(p)ppGpp synthetase [Spirochaetaceae bacterium]
MKTSVPRVLFDREKLRLQYSQKERFFSLVLKGLEQSLLSRVKLQTTPAYKARIKDFSSYYKKLIRLNLPAAEPFPLLTDVLGMRVVCAFLEDLASVERQIAQNYEVIEVERKGSNQTFREFGYESIHLLIRIPQEILREPLADAGDGLPAGWVDALVCEIQIRTILQDAWAEVEHELVYKSEFSPFGLPLRRKLASINASLTLADIIFQEIRDYQNRLNREVDVRRNTFYSKTDTISKGIIGESAPGAPQGAGLGSPFVRGAIDDLILEAIHAHNSGNYDEAIGIYTKIINFDPPPNDIVRSVIYKHRGMAFFGQSKYDEALSDFTRSCECDPKSFRSLYYLGIVYSIQEKYEDAVSAFDKSLGLNNYQAHVHYRMAAAKFKLQEYEEALSHLDDAKKLGLENDDTNTLRAKLVKKFDMKV